jgi:hypothetical protein
MSEKIVIENGMVVVPPASVPEIFSSETSIKQIVDMIRKEAIAFTPDLTTSKGRKEIASRSAMVSKSKVRLDDLGKDLTSEWKEKAKTVDAARKIARDDLDALRDEIRRPLTDWEEEQERIALDEQRQREEAAAAVKLAEEIEAYHDSAIQEDELRTLRALAAERARAEEEQNIREKKERDRLAYEAKVQQDAKEKADSDATDAIRLSAEEGERKLREVKADAERKEKEAADAARAEKEEAERRIRDAQEAAARSIEQARVEAEKKEMQRIQAEADERRDSEKRRAEEEKKAANKKHQAKVNNAAMVDLSRIISESAPEDLAKAIVVAIAQGKVFAVTINY